MVDEAEILEALQQGVIDAVAASDDPSLPVKYLLMGGEGEAAFEVPQDQRWLELVWIPNNRTNDFLGQEANHRGILRLILHWPKRVTGIYEPVLLLASITGFFTNGKRLTNGVQIYGKPLPTGMVDDVDDILFPVSVYYQSYRKGL